MKVLSDYIKYRNTKGWGIAINDAIELNRYKISVQASSTHYCSPRETYIDIDDYSTVEFAILNSKGDWFNPLLSSIIRDYPRIREIYDHADGRFSGSIVFGYVPVELVLDFIAYLETK